MLDLVLQVLERLMQGPCQVPVVCLCRVEDARCGDGLRVHRILRAHACLLVALHMHGQSRLVVEGSLDLAMVAEGQLLDAGNSSYAQIINPYILHFFHDNFTPVNIDIMVNYV